MGAERVRLALRPGRRERQLRNNEHTRDLGTRGRDSQKSQPRTAPGNLRRVHRARAVPCEALAAYSARFGGSKEIMVTGVSAASQSEELSDALPGESSSGVEE